MTAKLAKRIARLAAKADKQCTVDAAVELGMGLGTGLLIFGGIFAFAWVLTFGQGALGLGATTYAFGVMMIFVIATGLSAWQRVDPIRDVSPPTNREKAIAMVARSAKIGDFSPRHASAGFAAFLLGPAEGVFSSIGTWRSRINPSESECVAAARLLEAVGSELPASEVEDIPAAILLRRLRLIRAESRGADQFLLVSDRGESLLRKVGQQAASQD